MTTSSEFLGKLGSKEFRTPKLRFLKQLKDFQTALVNKSEYSFSYCLTIFSMSKCATAKSKAFWVRASQSLYRGLCPRRLLPYFSVCETHTGVKADSNDYDCCLGINSETIFPKNFQIELMLNFLESLMGSITSKGFFMAKCTDIVILD